MKIEIDFNFFTVMLKIKAILLLILGEFLIIIDPFPIGNRTGNLMKILFIKLLDFGPKDFGKYFINLIIMSKFNHPISLVNNEIFKQIEIKDAILQKLMYSPRRPNNNMWLSLSNDS